MTVITYKDGIVAADRMTLRGDTQSECKKLHVFKGTVIASYGQLSKAKSMTKWFLEGADPKSYNNKEYCGLYEKEDYAGIIIFSKGKIIEFEDKRPIGMEIFTQYPQAWGIGRELAIGAMFAGATAMEAVKAANKYCVGCGFGVNWVNLNKIKC